MSASVAGYVAAVSGGMLGIVPIEYRLDWWAPCTAAVLGQGSWALEAVHLHSVQPAPSAGSAPSATGSVKSSVSSSGICVQYRMLLVSGMGMPNVVARQRPAAPKCESTSAASRSRSCWYTSALPASSSPKACAKLR